MVCAPLQSVRWSVQACRSVQRGYQIELARMAARTSLVFDVSEVEMAPVRGLYRTVPYCPNPAPCARCRRVSNQFGKWQFVLRDTAQATQSRAYLGWDHSKRAHATFLTHSRIAKILPCATAVPVRTLHKRRSDFPRPHLLLMDEGRSKCLVSHA